jgi:hypothetical protein
MAELKYFMCEHVQFEGLNTCAFLCEDMSVSKASERTYAKATKGKKTHENTVYKDHPCFGYLQLNYMKNPFLYVTTPPMKCLFGVQKNNFNQFQMSLQFTDLDTDPTMKAFYEFIERTEFECMRHLGLTEEDGDRMITQIKRDKGKKYEPNLLVKLPFRYNRFETDIYSDHSATVNILQVQSFARVQCDIYLDKVWKMNNVFHGKWKCRCIHVL